MCYIMCHIIGQCTVHELLQQSEAHLVRDQHTLVTRRAEMPSKRTRSPPSQLPPLHTDWLGPPETQSLGPARRAPLANGKLTLMRRPTSEEQAMAVV